MSISPEHLRTSLASGVLAFPATPFHDDLGLNEARYRELYAVMASGGAVAMFPAGGAGELFSLTSAEHRRLVAASVAEGGNLPVIAGVGGSVEIAAEMARAVEAEGGHGLLLCPPYLVGGEQSGQAAYVERICKSVGIGVIVYNRDLMQLQPDTLARLADTCPNLIGFKDGVGSIEGIIAAQARLGDRITFLNGLPTAEIAATAYRALGIRTYSSAIYNFAPKLAMSFFHALDSGDTATVKRLIEGFYLPLIEIRRRGRGYAVSIVKAGLDAIGTSAGPVRPPLVGLNERERDALAALLVNFAQDDAKTVRGEMLHA